ncbi:Monooxygenase, FAD-binding [Moorella glycerini]|uniref:Electron transfer flavoprotein-ubiquinone oxidoreductase n=1 Tax=Neomoorella stamsii TaxID=1266720 RepID=A0A9X7J391_9FIRM|nr:MULTISPECIES: FAD-dependent oxidoreductase [Moorella]PRR72660.1 Electron transfer flavoprotein-ubiquinone oxidoreductase [Moorella stamsii]CEP67817.1 Monooxygenase, FAD-binding [Moorella glycerini]
MALRFEVVIVGAGPAGLAAAITLARAGVEVIIFERGEHPGSKNVMGGVLYRHPTETIVPGFYREAPLERPVVEQRLWLLTDEAALTLGYKSMAFAAEPYNAFTVLRARFDRWLAEQAVAAGALLINETVVEDLLWEKDRVVGVRTGRAEGDVRAEVVILAEGANSLLTQKAGLKKDGINTNQLAVAVKEIIALPREKIEDRFNLEEGQGCTIELLGDATKGMMGTAFIYTNKDSLSVGVGVLLSSLVRRRLNPNDLLEHLKSHPMVRRLLAGGESKEYQGHLIPEGGYRAIPKLYGNGVLVAGDAAMLVNGIHREGSNLAMTSGLLAAKTILAAREKGDYSEANLAPYREMLAESFVLQDLKKYQRAPFFFDQNPHFFTLYPQLLSRAAREFLTVDNVPKREKQKRIWREITAERSRIQLAGDLYHLWRVMG